MVFYGHRAFSKIHHFVMSALVIRLLVLNILLVTAPATLFPQEDQVVQKRYTIQRSSKLFLKGTSNVNAFTCNCEDRFPAQTFKVENGGQHALFSNVRLRMRTRKFNCQNGKIDRDMYKALKADEFAFISIELLETWYNPEQLKKAGTNQWFAVKAKVKLTITGVTKEQFIEAEAKKTADNQFSLRGEKSLLMTDYGIDPPGALFGLIKVNDLITFHFNLDISLEDVSEEQ